MKRIGTLTSKQVCSSKIRYRTKVSAWSSAVYFYTQYGKYMTPYHCGICTKFHLTGKKANPIPSPQFVREFNQWYGAQILDKDSIIISEYATRSNINS